MRGLKLVMPYLWLFLVYVASFTDAWIETFKKSNPVEQNKVASFTDAWIETPRYINEMNQTESHLLQMRGLKLSRKGVVIIYSSRIFYRCVD